MGAQPIGMPGCPELALLTASMERNLTVLIAMFMSSLLTYRWIEGLLHGAWRPFSWLAFAIRERHFISVERNIGLFSDKYCL